MWCGGKAVDTEPVSQAAESMELLGLRAIVHPDGADASITLHTSDGVICLSAQLEQVAAVQTEIRSAALLMQYRQTMVIDEGEDALKELLRAAPRPASSTVVVDATTGDRMFIMQFADRLPIVIRMAPEQVNELLGELSIESKRTAN